jgi:UDP-glucose 4-epimerase
VQVEHLVSGDVVAPRAPVAGVVHELADVTQDGVLQEAFERHRIDTVVHLASIVNPGRDLSRAEEWRIDVGGARAVLEACLAAGVHRLVVSSSGAAYGYHADNPPWLTEEHPLRGNPEFSYSDHKRQVEELLAQARAEHPELQQVVFRIGTILGESVRNPITALLERPRLLVVRGSDSPFVFIWDEDVAAAMEQAVTGERTGVVNLAGEGAVTVPELARLMGKPTITVPPAALALALRIGRALRVTPHGPERIGFLRYRPVLDTRRLREEFGFTPSKTSREAFLAWWATRAG